MRRVVKASKIPNLPRDHFKTIVRPRGGLDVRKADLIAFKRALARAASLTTEQTCEDTLCANPFQNILIVATPLENNARAYAKVQQICMGNAITEIAAYVAASDDTCKGVIRGINPDISEAELTDMIVNRRNPGALGVRRIKKTPTVIVLFDGLKVPQYVLCDGVRYPCSLYRRQVDICYACGDLGHRADVCPKGEDQRRCRGCGILMPPEDHHCDPKCAICEGPHLTGDRQCKKRFQVPFIVRQRRRRRRRARQAQLAEGSTDSEAAGGPEGNKPFSSQRGTRSASRTPTERSRSRSRSCSRSHSRSRRRPGNKPRFGSGGCDDNARRSRPRERSDSTVRFHESRTWAEKAKMGAQRGAQVTQGNSPEYGKEQSEILALRKENAELKEALQALRSEFERFRNSREPRVAQSPIPVLVGGPNKHPRFPTRLGNSVSRGTMPDLCFTKKRISQVV
ncbi:hypothetical protein HPB52_006785 [Rhipicephalus sanguineus]|uniref:CCHC-type domain-containing protein n=1 Tax=Rhipicephalus sanguineus TaxID=34632 RepID=A0A9D4QGX5_RHISA|nr:hypothetical protein HPB52_006785 [Rhipicephalus sanguineus]